ncbi:uncharacterized protein VTP21DRAFT_2347 [Calcarisporiella thermophila]|uniref:uncharacterized protein n=1 Tax=Calcarisporiella thermophila TaxID=911321 RepID=UPI003742F45A
MSMLHSWIFALFLFLTFVTAVKREDFKTCEQSSFCRRNRAYADLAAERESPYVVDPKSLSLTDGILRGDVRNTQTDILLEFELHLLQDRTARLRVQEKQPLKPRFDGLKDFVLVKQPSHATQTRLVKKGDNTEVLFGESLKVVIENAPFRMLFLDKDEPIISFNDRGFFNYEHLRHKKEAPPLVMQQEGAADTNTEKAEDDGSWEETWKGSTDTKPNGPSSFGLDISFLGFSHVYGIPEHATGLSLKETRGGENAYTDPYRLWNLDVFEYEIDNPMALYGSIPFMIAHNKERTVGLFWMNAAETWIDVVKLNGENLLSKLPFLSKNQKSATQTHWISESGVLDAFVFLGPNPQDIFRQYTSLTGTTIMPQLFSIAYHQCRWNYINQDDVLEVDAGFDKHDIPYDVIWLDIEHTDGKRYFTWDAAKFPDPVAMQNHLGGKGRKLVTIVDPHIKKDENYFISKEAAELNLFVKEADGKKDFEGWCWPGQSQWVDYSNPKAREWWSSKFKFDQYKGTTEYCFIWNDMNEPSVFNGPEISMPKNLIHHNGWEHRDLHNVFGTFYHAATADGLMNRTSVPKRPFVLSRAFFAGSQRFGAIWTGDNMATWEHLKASTPMILTNGITGLPFSGADVGGFFGNPESELLVRWYQAGAFQPFFRAHAHIDTKRREPWLIGDPYTGYIRDVVRERYALLPFWYTLFRRANTHGTPVVKPMFVVFPQDEPGFAIDDQYMVGDAILVKPVTDPGKEDVKVYFPAGEERWYNYYTHEKFEGHGEHTVSAPLHQIPVFYRGGHIVPRRERHRRSSTAMRLDPFTLVVALDAHGKASGSLYLDDGETFDFERGDFLDREFVFINNKLSARASPKEVLSKSQSASVDALKKVRVERVVVLGMEKVPVRIVLKEKGAERVVAFENAAGRLILRDPGCLIGNDWDLEFVF